VPRLPTGGSHRTRDVVFSPDGHTMYISVGSAFDVGDGMRKLSAAELQAWQSTQPLGAAWGNETDRAAVLAFDPDGNNKRICRPTTLRACARAPSMAGPGTTSAPTRIRAVSERPDLKDKITVPDVLVQAHSASLQMTFYEGAQFPAEYCVRPAVV
jgi:glucose/arabinose dehydrogenase